MRKSCLKFELVFFLRQIAIKEIILDPNKKNRTKEAVLKEARYIHLTVQVILSADYYYYY